MAGERLAGVPADVESQVHRVAWTAREPRLARRSVLESHRHPLAGEVAQHPRAPDLEMHDSVVGRCMLDPGHPCAHALRRNVVDSRRLGGLHHEIAAWSGRAQQRVSGPLLGIGDDVVVKPDPLDLSGDDSCPALSAAPVGTAERGRSPRSQRGFENGLPGMGLESMSRGIQLYREWHSARLVAGNRSWTHGLPVAAG